MTTTVEPARTAATPSTDGWHPLEALRILKKRRWPFLTAVILAVGVSTVVTLKTTPEFRAAATVNIESQVSRRAGIKEGLDGIDIFNQDYYQTQQRILQSRTLTERTMTKVGLWQRPEFASERDPVEAFQKRLDVAAQRNTRIVAVSFEHPDAKLAAVVVNTLVEEYRADNASRRVSTLREINRQLQKESDDLLAKLDAAERALQEYNQNHQLATVDEKQNVSTRRLDDALVALARAEEEHSKLFALQEQVAKGNGDVERLFSLKGVLDSKVIQDLFLEKARLERELADLRNRYKEEHPSIKALEARLTDTSSAILREVGRIVTSISAQVEEAAARVESAKVQLTNRKQEKLDLDKTIAGADALKRQRDGTKVLYDSLLSKIRESEVSSQIDLGNISVVDAAIPPRVPSKPNWKMNLALGMGAGILLGIGLLALLERIDSTIKSREEVEELLGLPVIGLVPAVKSEEGDAATVSLRDSKSTAAEAFRAVRTAVLLSPRNGHAPRRLLVTSSGPGEGKTCNSLNLAASLAAAGKRTLLIDCDFHRPQVHKHLELSNEKGFSDALAGDDALASLVQKVRIGPEKGTEWATLDVITTGPTPPNPAEILGTGKLKLRLDEASATYDHIVLDTPPVCAVTDAAVMAPHSDAVVLVVQPGLTDRSGAKRTVEVLSRVGVRPLGVVLNNLPSGEGGYGYYYYPKYGSKK